VDEQEAAGLVLRNPRDQAGRRHADQPGIAGGPCACGVQGAGPGELDQIQNGARRVPPHPAARRPETHTSVIPCLDQRLFCRMANSRRISR
jgi:hypothetical protein